MDFFLAHLLAPQYPNFNYKYYYKFIFWIIFRKTTPHHSLSITHVYVNHQNLRNQFKKSAHLNIRHPLFLYTYNTTTTKKKQKNTTIFVECDL